MSRPLSAPTSSRAPFAPSALPAAWVALRNTLATRWSALGPREKTGVAAAGLVIGAFLLWSLTIQPAWRTVRDAPVQIDRLGAELQTMQRLAAEATELRNTAPVSTAQAGAALQAATRRLGSRAQLVLLGDRATVTLKGLSGDDLRSWLAEARSTARARTNDAQLARDPQGYSGTLVLVLGNGR